MKHLLYYLFFLLHLPGVSQISSLPSSADSALWRIEAQQKNFTGPEEAEFINGKASLMINGLNHSVKQIPLLSGKYSSSQTHTSSCAFDFETGSLTSWTATNGYNPLFNTNGCCLITGADHTLTSGSGLDTYSGLPVVCPGGNFSLKLGSTTTGGKADRFERQFTVTPNDSLFTYKYAVVLNGAILSHAYAEQPYFTAVVIDTLGNPVPCTQLFVNPSDQTNSFSTSGLSANGAAVVYTQWTKKVLNLTPYIGHNVTVQFTVYDCSPSGHFAYAYLDADCFNSFKAPSDTICGGAPHTFCGPEGYKSYAWSGPSTNTVSKCIPVSGTGQYTCQTFIDTNCPGPTYVYSLTTMPGLSVAITSSANPCELAQVFNSTVFSTHSIISQSWDFGDGGTASSGTAAHTYSAAGQYSITFFAQVANGCFASQTMTFAIYPPVTALFSPDTVCAGVPLLLMNQSIAGMGNIVSNNWTVGTMTTNVTHPMLTFTAAGVYTPTLIVTSNFGCSDTTTNQILVTPIPQPVFLADTVCPGAATSFTNLSTVATGSISGFSWNFGNQTQSQASQPTPFVFAPAGSSSTTLTIVSDFGCSASLTKAVQFRSSPVISALSGSICEGSSFDLSPSGASTYSISGGTATVSPLQTTTYTVIGFNMFGCSDTLSSVTVTVYQRPVITVNSGSVCVGDSLLINPSGAQTYSINSQSFTVSPGVTTIFTVSGTDAFGCVSQQAGSATVVVHPLPTIAVNSGSICAGQSFTIIPQGASTFSISSGIFTVTPGTTTSYTVAGTDSLGCVSDQSAFSTVMVHQLPTVSVNSGSICNGQSFSLSPAGAQSYIFVNGGPVVSPTLTATYSVAGTSSAGCQSFASGISTVVVYPKPVVSLTASRDSICAKDSLSITAQGALVYSWNGLLHGPVLHPSVSGDSLFTVIGKNSSGCSDTSQVFIKVHATPVLTLNFSKSIVCEGDAITLYGYGTNNFVWENGSFTSSVTFTATQSKTYLVTGIGEFGCLSDATISIQVEPCLGVTREDEVPGITLFPNPADEQVTLQLSNRKLNDLRVYNQLGQLISHKVENDCLIRVLDWPTGIYNFVVQVDDSWYTLRFLKQ